MNANLTGPSVHTPIPGPRSAAYLDRQERRESNARTYPRNLPIAIRRAQGSFVEDVDGNVFLDFLAGAGVLSLGHNHPDVVAAISAQLGEFVHGLDFPTVAKDEFTSAQLGMLPGDMGQRYKVHFCGPTGANGVEAALKLAKIATGRGDVVAFSGGFHGSTAGAMAVTGNLGPKTPVANGMPGVHFFPFSHCRRCPLGLRPDSCETNCATYLERVLNDANGGIAKPAAVLLELVQGEGGTIPATRAFVRRVREITEALDIPLIVDEVQTGCGRTGTWFAFEQYDIEPDIVIASKALSGAGLPISLLFYRRELDRWNPGAHIGTFRGNQLAFAAGVAAVKVVREQRVLDNVQARHAQITAHLAAALDCHPYVADVRGIGLMWGIELTDPALARAVQAAALRRGLIIELGGRDDVVIRLLPPLTLSEQECRDALDILVASLAEAVGAAHGTTLLTTAA
ncbi:diaminobutyrate--2-oxoglutarate aminotransferase [Catellatospora sp. TT07R-123]|uniref:diaminobutyrate--2-oxoglutarate transaminase family protein n=1 Tax=Catellatospora sp. TT07R-123 TaxID=2733863 RepID=UPI001B08039D|nr:diaminobutyrate--2-oxoglutarate transaminase family protein [Catellatospora sp. TT07R-123]GHJ42887.1 diaminobutyrate--2-oxoglutarate aminotransferase [Catellatospora sp. TT07R-123]